MCPISKLVNLKMDAADSLETIVPNSQTTPCRVPSDINWFIAVFTRDFHSTLS